MYIKEVLWKAVAYVLSRKPVAWYLIKRARRTPYFHLDGYMNRWWLFNPYTPQDYERRASWLPSIRVHHILRADTARHLHDHPWNARTIILDGWYVERRLTASGAVVESLRERSDTAEINFGQYHSIDEVSDGGVYTLFFTWKYMGGWGFLVGGRKIPWRKYEQEYPT